MMLLVVVINGSQLAFYNGLPGIRVIHNHSAVSDKDAVVQTTNYHPKGGEQELTFCFASHVSEANRGYGLTGPVNGNQVLLER